MFENQTTLKIELGISAQQIASHLIINNEKIEAQIQKGIELAINELTEGDTFVNLIKDAAKKEFGSIVHKAIFSWDMRSAMEKSIREKMSLEMESYSNKLAEKLHETLKDNA